MATLTSVAQPTGTKSARQPVLDLIVGGTVESALRPRSFFLAWSGVPVLAWTGWSPALAALKSSLTNAGELPEESPGSLWPKTTLGCLKNGESLTAEEFERVKQAAIDSSDEAVLQGCGVVVDALDVVVYRCRSLERILTSHTVGLMKNDETKVGPTFEERERVDTVLKQWDEPGYPATAARDGSRETHYRAPHHGATLVAWLPKESTLMMRQIELFRSKVDDAVPGKYVWFDETALHVTLRGLS